MKKGRSNREKEMQAITIEKEVKQLFDINNQQNLALNKLIDAISHQSKSKDKNQSEDFLYENAFKTKVMAILNKVLKRK